MLYIICIVLVFSRHCVGNLLACAMLATCISYVTRYFLTTHYGIICPVNNATLCQHLFVSANRAMFYLVLLEPDFKSIICLPYLRWCWHAGGVSNCARTACTRSAGRLTRATRASPSCCSPSRSLFSSPRCP